MNQRTGVGARSTRVRTWSVNRPGRGYRFVSEESSPVAPELPVDAGHFFPEEIPAQTAAKLSEFFGCAHVER
jgi:hypothetical protein